MQTIGTQWSQDLLRITMLLENAVLTVMCYKIIPLAWMPAAGCNKPFKLRNFVTINLIITKGLHSLRGLSQPALN